MYFYLCWFLQTSSSGWTGSDLSHHSQKEASPPEDASYSRDQDAELERMRQLLHDEGQRREEERLRQQQMSQDAINHQTFLKMQVLCCT